MNVVYPSRGRVSVWVGTFSSENAFDQCVDEIIASQLNLETDIASICEIAFELQPVSVRTILDGFSGCASFLEDACSAAKEQEIMEVNSALVCYSLECGDAPKKWGSMNFLGSFEGSDVQ